ncbi:MAG: MFS transporter [Acidimicrobiia bacterium]|nr:MFS transporter [Acidimicrobiia bacterium]
MTDAARSASEPLPGDRRALAAIAVQFFVNGAVFASFIPRLPEIRDRVGIGDATVGLFLTIAGGCGLVSSALVGRLIDRFGSRRVLVNGAIAMVIVMPLVGIVTVPLGLLAVLIALSMLDVVVDVAMNLQGSWLSARRRSPVMNRLHGLWSLGTVVGGLGAAALATTSVPLQAQLIGVSALLLAAIVFVAGGVLRTDQHHEPQMPAPDGSRRSRWRPLVPLALAGAFAVTVEMTSSDWAAFRLTDDFASSAAIASLAYVAFTTGMTVGRFAGDAALVRLGSDRLLRLACVVAFVGLAAATLVPSRPLTLIGLLLAGLGTATLFPKLYDDAARFPGRAGAALGALTAGSRSAALIAPVLTGALIGSALSVGAAMAVVALPCIVGLYLVESRAVPGTVASPSVGRADT